MNQLPFCFCDASISTALGSRNLFIGLTLNFRDSHLDCVYRPLRLPFVLRGGFHHRPGALVKVFPLAECFPTFSGAQYPAHYSESNEYPILAPDKRAKHLAEELSHCGKKKENRENEPDGCEYAQQLQKTFQERTRGLLRVLLSDGVSLPYECIAGAGEMALGRAT